MTAWSAVVRDLGPQAMTVIGALGGAVIGARASRRSAATSAAAAERQVAEQRATQWRSAAADCYIDAVHQVRELTVESARHYDATKVGPRRESIEALGRELGRVAALAAPSDPLADAALAVEGGVARLFAAWAAAGGLHSVDRKAEGVLQNDNSRVFESLDESVATARDEIIRSGGALDRLRYAIQSGGTVAVASSGDLPPEACGSTMSLMERPGPIDAFLAVADAVIAEENADQP